MADLRYPLHWPEGWTRTAPSKRTPSRYSTSPSRTRSKLLSELRLLGARSPIISTNIELRRDGLPYSNRRTPDDPGVAVYWTDKGRESRVIACDRWKTIDENLHAITLAIEAIRAIDRTGASEILERAFRGFAALPAAAPKRAWREVMHVISGARPDFEFLKSQYRILLFTAHPDHGGTNEAFLELQEAYEAAKKELGYV